jgi:hypothetical protein
MNTTTKKKIAKEIIYFFSSVGILFLIWTSIQIKNTYTNNKIENYNSEISLVENKADSIKRYIYLITKVKAFNEIIGDSTIFDHNTIVPKDDLPVDLTGVDKTVKGNKKPWEMNLVAEEDSPNIYELYLYLEKNKFDFKTVHIDKFVRVDDLGVPVKSKWTPPIDAVEIPSYFDFKHTIKKEIGVKQQPTLEKIYSYLKAENKKFTSKKISLLSSLGGLPQPPPTELSNRMDELNAQKKNLKFNLQKETEKVFSRKSTRAILLFWMEIFFCLLYPTRLVIFLLIWLFKTIKLKE